MTQVATFNPNEFITKLPQGKDRDGNERTADYLEVKYRLVWFRSECPEGTIDTEEITVDLDREVSADAIRWVDDPQRQGKKKKEIYTKTAKGYARYKAIVTDGKGGRATAHKSESAVNFEDYAEKAETGAVGRALAMLGYGTQFTGDELAEDHRIVDSPVERSEQTGQKPEARSDALQLAVEAVKKQFAEMYPDTVKKEKWFESFQQAALGEVPKSLGSVHVAKMRGWLQQKKQKATAGAGGTAHVA